jgi:hypothetical protein
MSSMLSVSAETVVLSDLSLILSMRGRDVAVEVGRFVCVVLLYVPSVRFGTVGLW